MKKKSSELSAMYNNCIKEAKEEIKKILRANNNKVTWDNSNDIYILGIYRMTGEIDTMWVRGLELEGDNIRVLVHGGNYFNGQPISCDWLDILIELECIIEDKIENN